MEIAASARSMAGWQPNTVPAREAAREAPRESPSTGRSWAAVVYQVDSAIELIKLGQDRAKKSPIEQTLVSLAGAAGSRLIPPRSCPTNGDHLTIFIHADLSHSHLMGANMIGTHLSGANVSGVRFANPSDEEMTPGSVFIIPRTPIQGLSQSQLDINYANPSDPPQLAGINDAETGAPLVWRGGLRNLPRKRE